MDKQEIINKLKDFPYSRDEYWVITGSAMVLYGIREQYSWVFLAYTDEAKGHYELIYIQFIESKITWPHQTKMFDEVFFWRMSDED